MKPPGHPQATFGAPLKLTRATLFSRAKINTTFDIYMHKKLAPKDLPTYWQVGGDRKISTKIASQNWIFWSFVCLFLPPGAKPLERGGQSP